VSQLFYVLLTNRVWVRLSQKSTKPGKNMAANNVLRLCHLPKDVGIAIGIGIGIENRKRVYLL